MGNTVFGHLLSTKIFSDTYTCNFSATVVDIENDTFDYDLIFQQDRSLPDSYVPVIDDEFPGSWIGCRRRTGWLPRSPDLSNLDLFS